MLFATQKAPKSTRSVLSRKGHRRKAEKYFFHTFCTLQKVGKSCCSDVQKVAGGKFLCVGDRRNRENCERT